MNLLANTAEITVYPLREIWTMPDDLAEDLLAYINQPGVYETHEGNPYSAWYNERPEEQKSRIFRKTSAF